MGGNNKISELENNTVDKKEGTKRWKRVTKLILKVIGILILLILIISIIVGGYIFVKVKPVIEDAKEKAEIALSEMNEGSFKYLHNTVIFDKNNNELGQINALNYNYAKIADVSEYVYNGYVAVEDRNFKEHNGVDYKALMRAGIALIENKGKITQGGSTITQQVIKNNLLSQERTFTRKLIEFFMAPEIEEKFSKDEIMEFYVNTNFYGNNCYGIESASRYYFGKSAKDLSLAEAATLVGITNNPTKFNPVKNPEESYKKRIRVLNQMLEEEYISENDYNIAKNEELNLVLYREPKDPENYMISYAIYSTTLRLMELDGFEFKYVFTSESDYEKYKDEYGDNYSKFSEKIRTGGYRIYTSFDPEKQQILQKSVDNKLKGFTKKQENGKYDLQAAAVLINNETGYVEAVVGGRGTEDEFNRGFLAIRQPGSVAKPIVVYAPAFETADYYPSLKIKDETDENGPKNYGNAHYGTVSIRDAITKSINTIAYEIYKKLDMYERMDYLEKLEFGNLSYLDSNNGSLALGGFTYGVKPIDMARAYRAIENKGKFEDKDCIIKIEFENTGVVFEEKDRKPDKEVYTVDSAYMITDCMEGVVNDRGGTGSKARVSGQTIAGKTGTTNSNKDGWFCGFTRYYTGVVWVGCDQPKVISGLTGGAYPTIIWQDFMEELHKGKERKEFERPDTVITKNVNWSGKPVTYKSSYSDIFSQIAINEKEQKRLERLAKQKEEEARLKAEKEKQADINRQDEANKLLNSYEKLEINVVTDVYKIESEYKKIKNIVDKIKDTAVKDKYSERLQFRYTELLDEKESWSIELEEYEKEQARIREEQEELKRKQAEEERLRLEEQKRLEEEQKLKEEQNKVTEQIEPTYPETETNSGIESGIEYETDNTDKLPEGL